MGNAMCYSSFSLVQIEVHEHHQDIFLTYIFGIHIKFLSRGVKTGIPQKRKYDFSCPCPNIYVIKNSIHTYIRYLILDLNERCERGLLIY